MKPLSPIHIAYAEDHTIVRKGVISLLESLGDVIVDIEAENGRELISAIEKSGRLPDVCMFDINMPEMNGFDTLIQLRKKWPDIKTLALTLHEEELYIIKMIRSGVNGYMIKRSSPQEIKKAIQTIYTNGYYYSDIASYQYFKSVQNRIVKFPNFTSKELQVLRYCCTDLSYAEIGKEINATQRSVEGIRDSLFKKLNVHSRSSLVLCAIKYGIVTIDQSQKKIL